MTSILRNLNVSTGGKRICGIPQVGMLASQIPTGFPLAALLANDIDVGSPNRLYRVEALSQPSAGAFYVYEDSSFSFTAPDGVYTGTQRVRKYDPGVGLVTSEDTTYSLTVGASGGGGTPPASTVSGVTIIPPGAVLQGGATLDFDAVVAGANSPSQAVGWHADLGSANSGGTYTAPASTDVEQIDHLTATSTQDGTHSATVTITIPPTGFIPPTCEVEFRSFRTKPMRALRLA